METKTLSILQKVIIGILALIALVFFIQILRKPESGGAINGMIQFTYVVLAITVLLVLTAWLKDMMSHPAKLMQTGIAAVLFLVVIGVSKALSASEAVDYGKRHITGSTSSWVDTGLYTFYILGAIAILLLLFTELFPGLFTKSAKNADAIVDDVIDEIED